MARFDRLTVLNTVLEDGLVPLFYHSDLETAKKVATRVFRVVELWSFRPVRQASIQAFSGASCLCIR